MQFTLNGATTRLDADPERSLLEVLREDLGLTGAKYGCGEGQCGACTVIVDGRAVRACRMAMSRVEGTKVRTIEGMGTIIQTSDLKTRSDERPQIVAEYEFQALHPIQRAFIEESAMQCGYCVPGMIMSAVALLEKNPAPSRDEIIEGMNGNVCRCCNYPNLIAAVERAAAEMGAGVKS